LEVTGLFGEGPEAWGVGIGFECGVGIWGVGIWGGGMGEQAVAWSGAEFGKAPMVEGEGSEWFGIADAVDFDDGASF